MIGKFHTGFAAGGGGGENCCFTEKTSGLSFYGGFDTSALSPVIANGSSNQDPTFPEYYNNYLGYELELFGEGITPVSFTNVSGGFTTLSLIGSDGKWYTAADVASYSGKSGGQSGRLEPVNSNTDWVSAATGVYYSRSFYGINSSGELYVAGGNSKGQLGIGSTTNITNSLQKVTSLSGDYWTMVSAGNECAVAIHNGGLYFAGSNADYQTAQNTTSGNTISWTRPYNLDTAATDTKTDWVYCFMGLKGVMAVDSSGALWVAGNNSLGRLGTGNSTNQSGIKQVVSSGASKAYLDYSLSYYIDTSGNLHMSGYGYLGAMPSGSAGIFNTFQASHTGPWSELYLGLAVKAASTAVVGKRTNGDFYYWGEQEPVTNNATGKWMPDSSLSVTYNTQNTSPHLWPNSPTSIASIDPYISGGRLFMVYY